MSSSEFVLCDVVLPGGSVLDHRAVDDVDQVAFEYASSASDALCGCVAGQEFPCSGVEPLLDDCRGVEQAVQPAVAAAVQPVAFLVGGVDGDRSAPGVAGELGRGGEAGDVADLAEHLGQGPVDVRACPGGVQQRRQ